jgi:hypothetical protein
MRQIICFTIVLALAGLTGCGQRKTAPADEPRAQAATETQPISTEDFESGEVDGAVEPEGEAPEDVPATPTP